MAKLLLLRHLQSQWNKENRFTGWTDVDLSEEGIEKAEEVAQKLAGFKIDKVYTSPLTRNRKTVVLILRKLDRKDLPIVINKAFNERHYGSLQGLNKDEIKKKYGEGQVQAWRRGWDQAPPEGESLKDVYNRIVPFYKENVEKDLKEDKNVLIVASHNSLRALIKYLENISEEEIVDLEILPGTLKEYDF